MKLYTAEQLKQEFGGLFIETYPHHYEKKDMNGNWITVYEVRGISESIRENYNDPNETII